MNRDDYFDNQWHHGPGFGGPRDRMQMFQARRGDIKVHILKALANQPMHGYEIMRWLEEKSHGMWRPSPGSVYPTLQLLEDEDLVSVNQEDGKKVYQLTEAGIKEADNAKDDGPWQNHKHFKHHKQFREQAHANMKLIRNIIRTGDEEKINELIAALKEFSKKLSAISEAHND